MGECQYSVSEQDTQPIAAHVALHTPMYVRAGVGRRIKKTKHAQRHKMGVYSVNVLITNGFTGWRVERIHTSSVAAAVGRDDIQAVLSRHWL